MRSSRPSRTNQNRPAACWPGCGTDWFGSDPGSTRSADRDRVDTGPHLAEMMRPSFPRGSTGRISAMTSDDRNPYAAAGGGEADPWWSRPTDPGPPVAPQPTATEAVYPDAGQASPWGPSGAGTGWAPDGGAPSGSSGETTTQTRPEPSPWGAPVDTLGRDPGGRPANRAGLRLAVVALAAGLVGGGVGAYDGVHAANTGTSRSSVHDSAASLGTGGGATPVDSSPTSVTSIVDKVKDSVV